MSSVYDQDKLTLEKVCRVADEYEVSVDLLWQVYQDMLQANFEQDLIDLAKELSNE